MKKPTGEQRRKLKSIAHHYKPVIQIGQKGITKNQVEAVNKALDDHELIKIKFLDFKEEKQKIINEIVEMTGAELIGIIGNVFIIYRRDKSGEGKIGDLNKLK